MENIKHNFLCLILVLLLLGCSTAQEKAKETKVNNPEKQNEKPTTSASLNLIKVQTSEELVKAINEAKPGDSIFVAAGNYILKERIFINESGTLENGIYLIGDISGERPLLDFSNLTEDSSHQGMVLKADYWHIKGLQFYKAGDNGLHIRGNSNLIEFCSFFENADSGLQLDDGASNNIILNCDSYFNADSKVENADGFAVKMNVGSGNKFIGCRAWNNLDDGWDGYLRGADNIETTYISCWAFNNGISKTGVRGEGDGNGFKTGGSDDKLSKHNAFYYRCLAVGNVNDGFDHNSNRGMVSIINSAAMGNGRNLAFAEKSSLEKIIILNTLVLGDVGKYNAEVEKVINNSWQDGRTVTKEDFLSLDATELSAPRKPDGSLPVIKFLHLQKGSDLIDVGIKLDIDYRGGAPDLGAFEFK